MIDDTGRIVEPVRQYPVPPPGEHAAVCIDWWVEPTRKTWATQPEQSVRLLWQLEARNPQGKRFVASRRFSPTLGVGSLLRSWVEQWRGERLTPLETRDGLYLDSLIGVPCRLTLETYVKSDGAQWAWPQAIARWSYPRHGKPIRPESYVRRRYRYQPHQSGV